MSMYGEPAPDASLRDRLAWSLSEFVDDGAPMNIGRFRLAAEHVIEKFGLAESGRSEAEIKAEALNEAAGDVPFFEFMNVMDIATEVAPAQIAGWLRARAAARVADTSTEGTD